MQWWMHDTCDDGVTVGFILLISCMLICMYLYAIILLKAIHFLTHFLTHFCIAWYVLETIWPILDILICPLINSKEQVKCYDPPQFFSSIPIAPATAPAPLPATQPIPVQQVALPQTYIRRWPLSPMQVDPANVPLPTPSIDSDILPSDQPMPASPRICTFVELLQRQIIH